MQYAYLHGFASSPDSEKGLQLAERFEAYGIELRRPDLNNPSFAELTYSGMLESVDALDEDTPGDDPWCFIGSSMGGYTAARWAELHPDRVERLVLLCPGFNMGERWAELLGNEGLEDWKEEGTFLFFGPDDQLEAVHWDLYADAVESHPPYPDVSCETLILHGTEDEIVPIEGSRQYAESREHVECVELDDEHTLEDSVEQIADESIRWFDLE